MKKLNLITAICICFAQITFAQATKKEQDIKSIKDMCGCYDITFKYTETFAPEIDYEQHLDYTANARELALLIEDEEDKISIQHLLVINDTMVIKHWRQDWLFENKEIFHYDKDNNWVFSSLSKEDVKGQWTQKVYQVDDSPRYAGSATWVHFDGKHYWENNSDSPLPRREYSKRSDYNVMQRGNRQEITSTGWVHEQDNNKIIRNAEKEDVLLTQEKGFNVYTKTALANCESATKWWTENNKFWAKARKSWNKVYKRDGNLSLHKKVDEQALFMKFYELEKEDSREKTITKVIETYLKDNSVQNGAKK